MKLVKLLSIMAASAGMMGLMLAPVTVEAAPPCTGSAKQCLNSGRNKVNTGSGDLKGLITTVTNVLLFLIGAISVIMMIVGGIRYTTSNGNPEQIKAGKNTVMYALIGLVIAILAYAVVGFVIDSLT